MLKALFVTVAVVGLFVFGALPAMSDSENAAVVIKDAACTVFDGNGSLVPGDGAIVVGTHGGTTTVKCSVKGVANDTGKAVTFNFEKTGVSCNAAGTPTEDWHETVSKSGNATLVCKVKN